MERFIGENSSICSLDFGERIFNTLVAKFFSVDPRHKDFSFQSPYCFAANSPITFIDFQGEGPGDVLEGFLAAIADYSTFGLTNFRNWVDAEVPEDFNTGLRTADALVLALSIVEIGGGSAMTAAGLVTMEAGVASLVIPGVGEVTFVIAEVGGGAVAMAGLLVAGHGAILYEMSTDNIKNNNGYRKEDSSSKTKSQKGSGNKYEYERRVRDIDAARDRIKSLSERLKEAKGPKEKRPLQKELLEELEQLKTHEKALRQKFPEVRPE